MNKVQIILIIISSIATCIVLFMGFKIIRKIYGRIKELEDQLGRDATFNI